MGRVVSPIEKMVKTHDEEPSEEPGAGVVSRPDQDDDDPPPLEDDYDEEERGDPAWKEVLLDFINSKVLAGTMMMFTFYALFADDIRIAATEKPDDDVFFALSSVALALFTLELLLNIVGKRG